jgi:hypothetical protein
MELEITIKVPLGMDPGVEIEQRTADAEAAAPADDVPGPPSPEMMAEVAAEGERLDAPPELATLLGDELPGSHAPSGAPPDASPPDPSEVPSFGEEFAPPPPGMLGAEHLPLDVPDTVDRGGHDATNGG